LVIALSMGCASNDSRYRDNASLERPPELPVGTQKVEQETADEVNQPIRRHGKGLKSDVYMTETPPLELRLKRGFDESWSLLNRAIQLNELKVSDQDRSKGQLVVEFSGTGLFSGGFSLLGSGDKVNYELKVESQNEETRIAINRAASKEDTDSASAKDGFSDTTPENKSGELLNLLYDTLHDKVQED
jgi:NlpB/DapX lipoprotein